MRKAPRGEEKSSRVTAVLSAGARGYAPDPVFEIASKCARPSRNDSEKAVDSFCSAGKLTSGLPRPNAGLEQFQNTSPLIDSAAALPDEHSDEFGILQG